MIQIIAGDANHLSNRSARTFYYFIWFEVSPNGHCLDCRKHHGALFHASAVFPQDAVTIEGETRDYAGRFFCHRCGSSIFSRTADEIEVNLDWNVDLTCNHLVA